MSRTFSLMPVEGYSLDAAYVVQGSTHTFVSVRDDRSMEWRNYGGGWNDTRTRRLVASTSVYKEWLMECIPCGTESSRSGITFGVNGVCHTFANRELAFGNTAADVRDAAKDEYAVMFFGKYGFGIGQFERIVKDSYSRLSAEYRDDAAYNTVIGHINSYLDDEYLSWKKFATEVLGIDVESILRMNPSGVDVAKMRLGRLIGEREALYTRYCNNELNSEQLRESVKAAIVGNFSDYMDMLAGIGYMKDADAKQYTGTLNTLLSGYGSSVRLQMMHVESGNML